MRRKCSFRSRPIGKRFPMGVVIFEVLRTADAPPVKYVATNSRRTLEKKRGSEARRCRGRCRGGSRRRLERLLSFSRLSESPRDDRRRQQAERSQGIPNQRRAETTDSLDDFVGNDASDSGCGRKSSKTRFPLDLRGEVDRRQSTKTSTASAYYRSLGFFRARVGGNTSTTPKLAEDHLCDRRRARYRVPRLVYRRRSFPPTSSPESSSSRAGSSSAERIATWSCCNLRQRGPRVCRYQSRPAVPGRTGDPRPGL